MYAQLLAGGRAEKSISLDTTVLLTGCTLKIVWSWLKSWEKDWGSQLTTILAVGQQILSEKGSEHCIFHTWHTNMTFLKSPLTFKSSHHLLKHRPSLEGRVVRVMIYTPYAKKYLGKFGTHWFHFELATFGFPL